MSSLKAHLHVLRTEKSMNLCHPVKLNYMYREKYESMSSRKAQLHVLLTKKSMNQCHPVKLNYMYYVQRIV